MNNLQSAAINYKNRNLQTLPLQPNSKEPAGAWKPYQTKPHTEADILRLFENQNQNIGIIAGGVSNNLLGLDGDCADAFCQLPYETQNLIAKTYRVESARGLHAYFRTPYPVKKSKMGDIDIIGEGGYLCAPNSTHPSGKIYRALSDCSNIITLTHEDISTHFSMFGLQPAKIAEIPILPPHLNDILRGKIPARYHSRSEAEQVVIIYLIRAGYDFNDLHAYFHENAGAGTKFHEKVQAGYGSAWLRLSYENGMAFLETTAKPINPKPINSEIEAQISQIAEMAKNHNFNPRTALVDRAVFAAILQIAQRSGKIEDLGLSCREIAERTGITSKTVSKALRRIPLIQKTKTSKNGLANRHKFLLCPKGNSLHSNCVKDCSKQGHSRNDKGGKLADHDIFRARGLGKLGMALWDHMADKDWQSVKNIAESIGKSRKITRQKLEIMIFLGMVEREYRQRTGYFYKAVFGADMDKAAEMLGVAGAGERQRIKHEIEREAYRDHFLGR